MPKKGQIAEIENKPIGKTGSTIINKVKRLEIIHRLYPCTVFYYTYVPFLISGLARHANTKYCSGHHAMGTHASRFDYKGPSIVIIQTNYNKICGGYTPLSWEAIGNFKIDNIWRDSCFPYKTMKKYINSANKNCAVYSNINTVR